MSVILNEPLSGCGCDSWLAEYRVKQWFDEALQESIAKAKKVFQETIYAQLREGGKNKVTDMPNSRSH